jgi:hypothetical protein
MAGQLMLPCLPTVTSDLFPRGVTEFAAHYSEESPKTFISLAQYTEYSTSCLGSSVSILQISSRATHKRVPVFATTTRITLNVDIGSAIGSLL